jgi:acetylornithine aminotransferase
VPGFVHATGGDIDDLAKQVDDETCAVMFEPLRGEGGMLGYPDDFPTQARQLCDEHGISLIFDEVWTGGGRTGQWFGHHNFHSRVTPDIMTLGKAVGGGLPVGICWANPEHAAHLVPGTHGSTLGGNPICMAACRTVFDVIARDGLLDHATKLGDQAKTFLREKLPTCDVRGDGLFLGIELPDDPKHDVVAAALERGIILNVTQKKVVRLAPAIVISEKDWMRGLDSVVGLIDQSI